MSATATAPQVPTAADIAQLYVDFARTLELIVGATVRCSDAVIEDSCQFAWSALLHHRKRVSEETTCGWLVRTAIREALKQARRRSREFSLDVALNQGFDPAGDAHEPWELVAQREQMAIVSRLGARSQRFVWLRALGFSYEEMAAREHCTRRTVERQLTKARAALRDLNRSAARGPDDDVTGAIHGHAAAAR